MGAKVYLENNKLTEFREDVFKSMLQQMAATAGGVYVAGSNLDNQTIYYHQILNA